MSGRGRAAFGQGRIDAQLLPGACAHHRGKQAKLAHGAAAFTLQAGARQAAFAHGRFDQRIADGQDFLGDPFEERRALLPPVAR
jgi:hypothetical protein